MTTTAMEATAARARLTETQQKLDDVEQRLAAARSNRDAATIGRLTTERDALREFATEDETGDRAAREAALYDEARQLLDTLKQSFARSVNDSGIARGRALGLLSDAEAAISDSMQHYYHAAWAQRCIELLTLRFTDLTGMPANPTVPTFDAAIVDVEARTGPVPVVPRPLIAVTANMTEDERRRVQLAALEMFLENRELPDHAARDFFRRATARPLTDR